MSNNDNPGKIYEKEGTQGKNQSVLYVNENLSLEEQIAERAHEL